MSEDRVPEDPQAKRDRQAVALREAAAAMADYKEAQLAQRAKTARLRELRLAKTAQRRTDTQNGAASASER